MIKEKKRKDKEYGKERGKKKRLKLVKPLRKKNWSRGILTPRLNWKQESKSTRI